MPKPSIFSSQYNEEMKKRKRIKLIVAIVLLIIVLAAAFGGSINDSIIEKVKSGFNKSKEKDKEQEGKADNIKQGSRNEQEYEKSQVNEVKNKEVNKEEIRNNAPKTGSYNIKLSNGEEVKLTYNIVNNEKQYTEVLPKGINYDISPSKKNIVILENKTQNMILVDSNGNTKDITKKEYVSSKNDVFKKDNILKYKSNYVWCSSPKYLNEDNIVYVSQLPWFNKENQKYLWKYNISSNTHYHNLSQTGGELTGVDIKYGDNTPEGLEVIVDGVKNIIK
ncbi:MULTISPECIES: hypothetical protein [Clostridium]|uniref:Uncharacterized protein n=2 Tax=Clostridium TaxID=1485 RepID=A0A151ANP8_9CLOT|nr:MULTISPECIES: hypothetical protein [Clostridium]KYH29248.1 hypothetical protein CLCOL_09810 [Clostridium colicanis DSM 13634]MBE6042944.1 hypothetical protein [Clostridium thermopalmarium]PRR71037.1 hypothetical protein CPAL_21370 [Clostridium thermopalmarium DSM 5974]PVZ23624.1 hypothetical protein LX19_01522 [Clostridium thermopalmarium DSM 5974]